MKNEQKEGKTIGRRMSEEEIRMRRRRKKE